MLYLFLHAYAATRLLANPHVRLATCSLSPAISGAVAPRRRGGLIVMLNRVLLEPSECETTVDDELVAFELLRIGSHSVHIDEGFPNQFGQLEEHLLVICVNVHEPA